MLCSVMEHGMMPFHFQTVQQNSASLRSSVHPYIRSWESPWNFWQKAGQKLGIFPRNLLGFLGFHANEEAGKVSNFSQESSDRSWENDSDRKYSSTFPRNPGKAWI